MQPSDHLDSYRNRVQRTRRLLARQVTLHGIGLLPKTELEAVYELAFLNTFVAFENELTELLKTNLMMSVGSDGRSRSKFIPANRADAARLILGTQRYFQLLPIEQMEKITKVYLKDGKPFTTLSASQKDAVGKCHAIRNHIAHKSTDSKATYIKKVRGQVTLSSKRTSPGLYLRSSMAVNRTYFDHHIAELGGIMNHLCTST